MGNCLITKLNVSVNNPLLEEFDTIILKGLSNQTDLHYCGGFRISFNAPSVIYLISENENLYFTDTSNATQNLGKIINVDANKIYTFNVAVSKNDGVFAMKIKNKKNLTQFLFSCESIGVYNFDLSFYRYLPYITNIFGNDVLIGNIENIKDKTNITDVNIAYNKKIIADILDFKLMMTLKKFEAHVSDNITGTIESFVAYQYANGRKTAQITTGTPAYSPNLYTWGMCTFNNQQARGMLSWKPNESNDEYCDVTMNDKDLNLVTITIDTNGNKIV